jgi:hypothetical protein
MKTKKIGILLPLVVLGLGLSGCGKDNYNGTYTGTAIRTTGQTGGNSQVPTQSNVQYQQVSANLQHNRDIVSGTFTLTMMQGGMWNQNQQWNQNNMMGGESYRFEASARESDRLTDVRLMPMNGYGCMLTGTLESIQNGRRLRGTLSPTGGQNGSWGCGATEVTLDRPNN